MKISQDLLGTIKFGFVDNYFLTPLTKILLYVGSLSSCTFFSFDRKTIWRQTRIKFIRLGLADSPECDCHYKNESPEHYFVDCFLYSPERQTLFSLFEHHIPNFNRLPKKKKLDLIIRGINIDDEDYLPINTILTKAVQHFILATKRFTLMDNLALHFYDTVIVNKFSFEATLRDLNVFLH